MLALDLVAEVVVSNTSATDRIVLKKFFSLMTENYKIGTVRAGRLARYPLNRGITMPSSYRVFYGVVPILLTDG